MQEYIGNALIKSELNSGNNGEEEEVSKIYANKSFKRAKKYVIFLLLSFLLISLIIFIFYLKEERGIESKINYIGPENYSFTAIYKVESFNQSISLIRRLPHNDQETFNIIRMFINNEEVSPCVNYTFSSPGIYTVNFVINDILKSTYLNKMFADITNMTSISFAKNFNTKNIISMISMFYNCRQLTSIDLRYFDTSKVINLNSLFDNCSSLTSLDLTNFNTENVINFNNIFYGCNKLSAINISNWNTKNAKYFLAMFGSCYSLTSIDLSSFNTENVIYMIYMFSKCTSLTSLNLSNFNTENVEAMTNMFYGCSSLTSLDLSIFDTNKVYEMSYMFYGCTSLKSLNISNFSTQNVKCADKIVFYCQSLTLIDFSHFDGFNIDFFDNFPKYGKMKVNEKFVKEIAKKLPEWIIIPAN